MRTVFYGRKAWMMMRICVTFQLVLAVHPVAATAAEALKGVERLLPESGMGTETAQHRPKIQRQLQLTPPTAA
jgi:hypothetical protein